VDRSNLLVAVLIIELDRGSGEVGDRLRQLGYGVECARDLRAALDRLRSDGIDLVVLGEAGSQARLRLCAAIRARCGALPILLLGADARERDALCRSSGPDDYVSRALDLDEIAARARSLLRRCAVASARVPIECGPLRLDADGRRVAFGEQEARLTHTEYELLSRLARSPGRAFSRRELLNAVWGNDHAGHSHTLTTHVNRLRCKLERALGAPRLVETVHGLGYRFARAPSPGPLPPR
jgi:DNA-binding response OmpR family regulator